ncbi:MAG: lipid-A-disaccharide synthase N-terminal domain-containing protein [Acidobacteriota bacterium]|nr:lipid-A-disaccharide synthase N-terminal domain-containing protein [Acidobacteriota bacterium]
MSFLTLENIWVAVGFGGQALFGARFLVQWIATERRRQSVVPTAFWYLSLGGGLVLLSYAVSIGDPVFITGQSFGVLVYSRNLWFVHRHKANEAG